MNPRGDETEEGETASLDVCMFCFLHLKLKILLITDALFLKVIVG